MFSLRQYQQKWVRQVEDALRVFRYVLGVLPTGGGKTVCFSELLRRHGPGGLAVVHRKEIIAQISIAMGRCGIYHRVIAPDSVVAAVRRKHMREFGASFVDQRADAGVASVQTLTSKSSKNNRLLMEFINRVTFAVFDEGHHYIRSGLWGRAVDVLTNAKCLFVTATPERADGVGLGDATHDGGGYCQTMIEGPTTRWLIEQGFLCDFDYLAPETDADFANVAVTKTGDFNAKALRQRVVDSHMVGDVVGHYLKYTPGQRAIVFATDVATADEIAAEFAARSVRAVALSGQTPDADREHALNQFAEGALDVLINVDLFDEGFDVPAVEAVILARPTESLAKYLQQVGRVLRIMNGKTIAAVLDCVRNWERHGGPTWPRQWSLSSVKSAGSSSSSDTIKDKHCAACTRPYPAFHLNCPYCGYVDPPVDRSGPEKVDGDLTRMDMAAFEQMFKEYQAANMPDDEFERDMIRRNVPPIGRSQQAKKHRTVAARRQVLRNLLEMWGEAQPADRSDDEKQRRFYLRYNVDVMSAFTLDLNQTNALIDRLAASFHKDVLH